MPDITNILLRSLRKITAGSGIRLGRLGERDLPAMSSALKLSDTEFLRLFCIDDISELVRRGQVDAAKSALMSHFRQRVKKDWLKVADNITDLRLKCAELSNEDVMTQAESILQYRLTHASNIPFLGPHGKIDWTKNPTSNKEWLLRLNRHQWWTILALAYGLRKDERYAQAFVSQLQDWVERNPPPKYKNETSPTWRLMEVGLRMRISWIPVFALFFDSPSFTDELKLKMLRSIYDHARFLSLFKSKLNHLVRESNGLICVSIYFPEFHESQSWRKIALNRLESALLRQINRDGSQIEVSTGYQMLVIEEFEQTYELLRANAIELPNVNLGDWLEKMYRVLLRMTKPDGTFPEINDGFLLTSREVFKRAGERFKRDDFVFVGTGGNAGTVPNEISTAVKDAGIYIMRSDWSRDARYLLFDAGPYGGFHGHEDKLNVEVFAHGQSFIVDSGSYTYEKTDPYRKYFVGSQGHNTVLVDWLSQVRRWHDEHNTPRVASKTYAMWESQVDFDYVCATYDEGYAQFALKKPKSPRIIKDVTHTRHVIFVKPNYWLIVDELHASEPHDYQLLFHCHPEIEVEEAENKCVILNSTKRDSALHIIPAYPQEVAVSWVAGVDRPIQGWYSLDHHRKLPAPEIHYEICSAVCAVFVTLLYPVSIPQQSDKPSIKVLGVSDPSSFAYVVESRQVKDYLLLSKNRRLKRFGPFESDAILAGYRVNEEGETTRQFTWFGNE